MRSRITITITQSLLNKVDASISSHQFRNRSQAIEALVKRSLSPSLTTAVILAGGAVSKSQKTPRALKKIQGIPLIDHTLSLLKLHGFSTIIICTGKLGHHIQKHCGSGAKYSLKIKYSKEVSPLGTGGALKKASSLLPPQPFLLIHSDILTNINLTDFISAHNSHGKLASLATKAREGKTSYGRIALEGSQITSFHEPKKTSSATLINTGIYILDHSCLSFLPKQKVFKLETTLLPTLIKQQSIAGYPFQGIWYDISSPIDYAAANHSWSKTA